MANQQGIYLTQQKATLIGGYFYLGVLMDYLAIRNKLAMLTRGQTTEFKIPELTIEVHFTKDGAFRVFKRTHAGSSDVTTYYSLKETVNALLPWFTPAAGQVYQHLNGNIYTVTAIANEHSTRPEYPPSVVYKGENGLTWCKPLENFQRKMSRIK